MIGQLIQTLSSPKIAIDDRHTPKLYARFLAGLLSRHRGDGATVGRLQTIPPPQRQVPGSAQNMSNGGMPSVIPPRGSGIGQGEQGFSQGSLPQTLETPIYTPEVTFGLGGTGQIFLGSDFDMSLANGFSEEEMLATMQAIKNPAWWQNMMMPGYVLRLALTYAHPAHWFLQILVARSVAVASCTQQQYNGFFFPWEHASAGIWYLPERPGHDVAEFSSCLYPKAISIPDFRGHTFQAFHLQFYAVFYCVKCLIFVFTGYQCFRLIIMRM